MDTGGHGAHGSDGFEMLYDECLEGYDRYDVPLGFLYCLL